MHTDKCGGTVKTMCNTLRPLFIGNVSITHFMTVTFVSCVKRNKDIFEIFSPSGSQAIIEFYALVNLKPQ